MTMKTTMMMMATMRRASIMELTELKGREKFKGAP